MNEVFEQYDQQFNNITDSLLQKFRRSYRANEQETVQGYKDLQEAEKCIKSMEVAMMDIESSVKAKYRQILKQHKEELLELKDRFKAYQNIIESNKQNGNIIIDDREQRLLQAEKRISSQNMDLIQIKRQAYQTEHIAINAQNQLNRNNQVIDKTLQNVRDTNQGIDQAERFVQEMQRRILMNKCLIYGVMGVIIIGFVFIIFYRLVLK